MADLANKSDVQADFPVAEVPVRQWVLSFPWPLRLLFASRPDALGRCLAVIVRAIQTDLARRAGATLGTTTRQDRGKGPL